MKIKTSELTGPALAWAAAQATPDLTQGGPIIEGEGIAVRRSYNMEQGDWQAIRDGFKNNQNGPTPLIAAMRCYVASKLGEEVEVPNEFS